MRIVLQSWWRWVSAGVILALTLALLTAVLSAAPHTPTAGLITGTITDPAGLLPPALTEVGLISPGGDEHGRAHIDPSTGNFSLGPVPNGNYLLQAWPPANSDFTPSLPLSLVVLGGPVDVGSLPLTTPSLNGTVYAPNGLTPTPARLRVFHAGYQVQSSVAPSGTIQIGGLLSGTYHLLAEPLDDAPYWQSATLPITITTGQTQTISFTLRPANIVGVITNPQGVPVPGARVYVAGLAQQTRRQDITSLNGSFAIGDLPPDGYVLVAEPPWRADGLMASAAITLTIPPTFTNLGDIPLRSAPKVVTGLVTTNNDVPIENALVVAQRVGFPGHEEVLTHSNGRYQLPLSGGLWALTIRPTNNANPPHWIYTDPPYYVYFDHLLYPQQRTVDFTVTQADAQVMGLVTMPDGSPPPFTVTVSLRDNEGHGRHTLIDPTNGTFSLHLPHGQYTLSLHPADPGYAGPSPQIITVPPNGTVDVGIATLLARDAVISGQLFDETGNGVAGVQVAAWTPDHLHAQAYTSLDGGYVLPVTADTWLVRPFVPADLPYVYLGTAVTVTPTASQIITDIHFTLTPATNVVIGHLVDNTGQPVNVSGWVGATSDTGPINGAPIQNGEFRLYLPDGTYQVGPHLSPDSRWLAGPPQPVTVAGGSPFTTTFTLAVQDATITGSLWDPIHHQVVADVAGYAWAGNGWARVGDSINTANGAYRLHVAAGLWHLGYNIDPRSGYVALNHHTIVPLESDQTVIAPLPVAQRDAQLSGLVVGADGLPLAGALVAAAGQSGLINQVTLHTLSAADGTFQLAVPAGVYQLRAAGGDPAWLNPVETSVEVLPHGQVTGIELVFRQADATVSGTVSLAVEGGGNGRVHLWAYTDDGAATHTSTLLGQSYTLNLVSGHTWHIGAILETGDSFYATRQTITLNSGPQTLDLLLDGPHPKPGPVVVTFDPTQEQQIALADGTSIFIPAGAMPATSLVTLHITPIATFPHQHHARLYKYGYAFIATDETGATLTSHFNQNVIISFHYTDADLAAWDLRESRLRPAYYSTTSHSWTVPDSYVVDSTANQVTMQIDHFTDFSLTNDSMYELFLPVTVH